MTYVTASLLVTVLLLVHSSLVDSTVKLSVSPNKFAIGTQHTAECTVTFGTNVYSYGVILEFNSNNVAVNPNKSFNAIGSWAGDLMTAPSFTPVPLVPEANGLDVVPGEASLIKFEFKFTPKSDVANGKYQCHFLQADKQGQTLVDSRSNVWNASFATIPSVVILLMTLSVSFKFQ